MKKEIWKFFFFASTVRFWCFRHVTHGTIGSFERSGCSLTITERKRETRKETTCSWSVTADYFLDLCVVLYCIAGKTAGSQVLEKRLTLAGRLLWSYCCRSSSGKRETGCCTVHKKNCIWMAGEHQPCCCRDPTCHLRATHFISVFYLCQEQKRYTLYLKCTAGHQPKLKWRPRQRQFDSCLDADVASTSSKGDGASRWIINDRIPLTIDGGHSRKIMLCIVAFNQETRYNTSFLLYNFVKEISNAWRRG